jgi:hypothetical protein
MDWASDTHDIGVTAERSSMRKTEGKKLLERTTYRDGIWRRRNVFYQFQKIDIRGMGALCR